VCSKRYVGLDLRKILEKCAYTDRSESIKQMVRSRKVPGRANLICDMRVKSAYRYGTGTVRYGAVLYRTVPPKPENPGIGIDTLKAEISVSI
jgi:hypothetical protein